VHTMASGFTRRTCGRWTWMIRRSGGEHALESILGDPDAILAAKADIIKASGSSMIARFAGYVIKSWASEGMAGLLKDCARRPKAERAALNALRLAAAGIPTATPLAWGAKRGWGLRAQSVLVMEDLAGAVDLGGWKGFRLPVIGRIGRLIGHLHRAGFTHRDLKPTNLLITPHGSPYLIDLDALRQPESVHRTDAVADVVKLARRMVELSTLSPKEAAVFVAEYASVRDESPRRRWWNSFKAEALLYPEFRPGLHADR
jgi:tRNA A-37 threonylcarbamoyl transferase component Bud32